MNTMHTHIETRILAFKLPSDSDANNKMNPQIGGLDNHKLPVGPRHNCPEILGESPPIKKTLQLVFRVAPSKATVLILGETGTGKELVARAIHDNSPRKDKVMIKVNCAALPADLIESELFGHERGSFTGAIERRVGKFELAHKSTLFLDEIGEMPPELQVKLLRVLQEKEIERIGGKTTIKVDVRIVAATNRELEREMAEGRFRRDLYYRLNIFPIHVAPLRDRREDILMLAANFLRLFSGSNSREVPRLSNGVIQQLVRYDWPGNIRELEHLIERSVLLAPNSTISYIDLPSPKLTIPPKTSAMPIVLKTIDENERDHILQILQYCRGRIGGNGGAAAILGVPPSTLQSKMRRLGIRKGYFSKSLPSAAAV
jgi:formate hydrogenlyase transcriptional activator